MSKYWRYRILTNQPCEDEVLNDSTKAKLVLDDPSDFRVPRSSSAAPRITSASNPTHEPTPAEPPAAPAPQVQNATSSSEFSVDVSDFLVVIYSTAQPRRTSKPSASIK
ncbi:hypothetical protein Y032_0037g3420 [Ancylostoma ceylanicum]|uniref:Uncharacterized protein n=1 Tax=Ancylostoma ceylanicum TaxID=53326 RepID=A0A016UL60_9BILA|nr:hypothetical protein Y032_0037g3420 [Ancylostoma ceylanicum]